MKFDTSLLDIPIEDWPSPSSTPCWSGTGDVHELYSRVHNIPCPDITRRDSCDPSCINPAHYHMTTPPDYDMLAKHIPRRPNILIGNAYKWVGGPLEPFLEALPRRHLNAYKAWGDYEAFITKPVFNQTKTRPLPAINPLMDPNIKYQTADGWEVTDIYEFPNNPESSRIVAEVRNPKTGKTRTLRYHEDGRYQHPSRPERPELTLIPVTNERTF